MADPNQPATSLTYYTIGSLKCKVVLLAIRCFFSVSSYLNRPTSYNKNVATVPGSTVKICEHV